MGAQISATKVYRMSYHGSIYMVFCTVYTVYICYTYGMSTNSSIRYFWVK